MWMRRLAALAAFVLIGTGVAPAAATGERLLTVDDLVGLEAFGRAQISPDGRWAVYERRGGYDDMERIALGGASVRTLMDLWVVDLLDSTPAPQRLLPEEGPGLQTVAWAPDGARLLVTRLQDAAFEYGIVDMADRSVRWTGLAPDLPTTGAFAAWASAQTVILAVRPDGSLPLGLDYTGASIRRTAEARERTMRGLEPSRTVIEASGGVLATEIQEAVQTLVRVDAASGETRVLAEGRIADFAVSPDGAAVALVLRAEPIPLAEPELLHMEDDRRRRLRLIGVETGETLLRIEDLDIAPHLLRWSPDSGAVLVWARRDGARWEDGGLARATTGGVAWFDRGGVSAGRSPEIVLSGVRADWLGRDAVLYGTADGSDRRDWHLVSRSGPPRALTAALTSAPTRIAAATPDALHVFADGGDWTMTAGGLTRRSPQGVALREATAFDLDLAPRLKNNEAPRRDWAAAMGPDGRLVVISEAGMRSLGGAGHENDRVLAVSAGAALTLRPEGLQETLQLRRAGGVRDLDRVNAGLAEVRLTEPIPVRHPDWTGQETTSWLFLPRPSPRGIRGVIVRVYPGWADNLARVDPFSMTYSRRPEVFVAQGYAVLSASIPGDVAVQERGDAWARAADLAVDAALEAFPGLPEDRMTLMGHSFGGHAALEIAVRSSRFRSYVASSPYSDMLGVWGAFDAVGRIQPENGLFFRFNQGWTEAGQGALGAPPWAEPELYAASSPFLRADRITRPVLLLTADLDFTPMSQAERMFSAILRNGGEARMVTYWGETHLIWSPANIRDYHQQIFDWLEKTLRP